MSRKGLLRELKIEVAGIVISVTSDDCDSISAGGDVYERFITNGEPEVVIRVHCGDIPEECNLKGKIFDSGSLWSLYHDDGKRILRFGSPAADSPPNKLVILEPDFKSCDIYIRAHEPDPNDILAYPLIEVLVVNLLSLGRGGMFHTCGIKDNDRGILFVGTSGAGKSTLANLLKSKKGIILLSDDRIIIRKIDGRFWTYGTPWHGNARVCSPEKAPLERIFFLNHARENKAEVIERIDAASKLLVCSFPPFWSKQGMEFTLGFIDELTREVPCYDLGFLPNETVIDFVKNI